MSSGIPPDAAELFAGLVTCILYGVNVSLIGPALLLLVRKARTIPHLWFVFVITVLQFGIITGGVAVYFRMLYEGFVLYRNQVNPTAYFADISSGLSVARFLLFSQTTIWGDGLLVWRCFMVYNKALWIIILSSIVFFTKIVLGSYAINLVINLDPAQTLYMKRLENVMMSWYVFQAAFDIFLSSLVAYRVWCSIRATSSAKLSSANAANKHLIRFLLIFLQSAAVVPIVCVLTLGFYASNNNAQMITFAFIPQLLAGSPNVILLLSPSAFSSSNSTLDPPKVRRSSTAGARSSFAPTLTSTTFPLRSRGTGMDRRESERSDEPRDSATPAMAYMSGRGDSLDGPVKVAETQSVYKGLETSSFDDDLDSTAP